MEYFFGTTVLSLVETRTESNYLSEELVDSLLSIAIDTPLPSTKVDKTDKFKFLLFALCLFFLIFRLFCEF